MALGLRCSRLVHPAFCNFLAALTRPVSEVTLKTVSGRQNDHGQYLAYPAVPIRHFATKKAKAKGKGQSQTRMNLNTALVEDIISLEEVDEEMKSVIEALKDNFNKTVNIRTSPGSLDHITVVTADGKLALNQIGQISMKSPQLILVNMASFPETMTKPNGPRLLCGPPVCDFCISIWSRPSRNSHSIQTGLNIAEYCTEHSASKAGSVQLQLSRL
ncbi:ribosome-recycling factor, mitochondrial isoform X2 [Orcinus orca]|uniref:ribosome-recycling factor, mitochondrial isoform X2 n=1 Tax=Orcinus orca TaxID=9733 RepID=UPI00144128FE|nr:ribosome-recycling factor, mitochondrial isoform X2 [Orcinus orca]